MSYIWAQSTQRERYVRMCARIDVLAIQSCVRATHIVFMAISIKVIKCSQAMSSTNERTSEEDSQSGCVRVAVSDRRPACTHLSRRRTDGIQCAVGKNDGD